MLSCAHSLLLFITLMELKSQSKLTKSATLQNKGLQSMFRDAWFPLGVKSLPLVHMCQGAETASDVCAKKSEVSQEPTPVFTDAPSMAQFAAGVWRAGAKTGPQPLCHTANI